MMKHEESFDFRRSRGIVWVCDIANSSRYLNDQKHVDYLENFLTRFHWFSRIVVRAAGGKYIKWTGDGFLAWFECELKRNLKEIANTVFETAWNTTFITNITQMGLESEIRISVRNALTFEEDALITLINTEGNKSIDILGRAVVLCFRLSSVESEFPNIVSQGNLIFNENSKYFPNPIRVSFTEQEIDKYFKGEKWQTDNIYRSEFFKGLKNKKSRKMLLDIDFKSLEATSFLVKIKEELSRGPEWSKDMYNRYISFLKDDMYESLRKIYSVLTEIEGID